MLERYFSYKVLIGLALILGVMPVVPQPHLIEKISMLLSGTLTRPIDIFDLLWHSWPILLLIFRLILDRIRKPA